MIGPGPAAGGAAGAGFDPTGGLGRHDRNPGPRGLLAVDGEVGALIREYDWSATPFGPLADWPQSLRSAVSICLASRFPIVIAWGPELALIYNDAYIPILGGKHPRSLGQPARECWWDLWPVIGEMLEGVLHRADATFSDDLLFMTERNDYREETYFTFSHSPIEDESGGVGGVFCAITETTQRVLGERRLRTLNELGERVGQARTAVEACRNTARVLAANPHDVPFALFYLLDEGSVAQLVASCGLGPGEAASPVVVDADADADTTEAIWPLIEVASSGRAVDVTGLAGRIPVRSAVGDLPVDAALVMPIAHATSEGSAGLIVAGVSPSRALDEEYRSFFTLLARQVANAVADARAYEAERERAEALAEIDRAKTVFFSNISHEFRTPLTLMLGPVEDVLARDRLPDADRRAIEIVHRNAVRLLKLVNTLLDFSRLEAGRIRASYVPVDLAACTAELAGVFRAAIERAGLRLAVDAPPLPGPVYVDRDMWEKVVLNLLSNALKFTFEGGIEVRVRDAGQAAEVTVLDTGVGIAEDQIPRLFQRFQRIPGTRARTHEGSGIGLSLVHQLVGLHGGTVTVDSAVGVGSAFTVRIPFGATHLPADAIGDETAGGTGTVTTGAAAYLSEAAGWTSDLADNAAAIPGIPPPPPGRARVLVVDDNADMRDYVIRLLSDGYEVEAAGDGAAALHAVRNRPPDLVLTDVMMPGVDGFELLRALRADPRTAHIPVIMLTARAGEESAVDGLAAGADDYLVKPFSARELLARIRSNVELATARQATAVLAEREADARRRAERDATLQRLLADASARFAANLDTGELLGVVGEVTVPAFADTAAVHLLDSAFDPSPSTQSHVRLAYLRVRDEPGAGGGDRPPDILADHLRRTAVDLEAPETNLGDAAFDHPVK